ncbi:APC family permease [Steroidobacter sp.]|uniref:APC family permease n=1 Tax=Steroidobacter sp. TaxID=1978227 RepID=UPI001A5FEEBB|nr:APC family permease [Steroidobacter sp.]MBL8267528.1 APC family permease [Steroidobacter sp.]
MNSSAATAGLGLFQLFTVLFGTIIGVAWIVATGMWVIEAGPIGALVAFGIGALVMWLIGLCFAEMMTMYPDANGSMAYVFEAFGERVSAAAGWLLVFNYAATCAWYFVTLAWLIQALIPQLGGSIAYTTAIGSVRWGDLLIGATGMIAITAVNLRGVGARALFQDAFVIAKIVIGLILFAGAAWLGQGERLDPLFAANEVSGVWLSILSVAIVTPFFFSGFDVLPQAVRDRRADTPLRALGTVVTIATLAAFLFYGGAIVSASVSLERAALGHAGLPVFEAFRTGLHQPGLAALVIVAGVAGVLTGWNACLLSGARILQGMAHAGATLPFFASPVRATLSVSLLALSMGALGRKALGPIVDMAAIPLLVVFSLVCAGLIKLRREQPQIVRPYRVPGGLSLPRLAVALSIGLLISAMVTAFVGGGDLMQWGCISLWCVLGLLFWQHSATYRNSLSEQQRKRRVLRGEG